MDTPANGTQIWRFGVFEVDARRAELRRGGNPVKVREQSFRILVHLLEHAGEIVTREELRRVLWPSDTFVDFEHSLNTAVMKLRDALGDSADAPLYIETIPKRGYRFIAPVSESANARDGLAKLDGDFDSPVINETTEARQVVLAPAETPVPHRRPGRTAVVAGLAASILSNRMTAKQFTFPGLTRPASGVSRRRAAQSRWSLRTSRRLDTVDIGRSLRKACIC